MSEGGPRRRPLRVLAGGSGCGVGVEGLLCKVRQRGFSLGAHARLNMFVPVPYTAANETRCFFKEKGQLLGAFFVGRGAEIFPHLPASC